MGIRKLDKKGTRVLTSGLNRSRLLKSKRSAEKYYLVISIILGLIILIIALYWIFQEYFGQEISKETCRQSIILRASMPDSERLATRSLEDLKNNFPLKCKTEVVNVDLPKKPDVSFSDNVSALIAQKMNECWYMFGEGKYFVFPIKGLLDDPLKNCVICARIHFPAEASQLPDYEREADVMSYFYTHYVGGKEIPESKYVRSKDNKLVYYNTVDNSYASYLHFFGGVVKDGTTLFPNNPEWATNSKTGRMTIDIGKGDVIIGVYSFTDTQLSLSWHPVTPYRWMRPFYAQVGVDSLSGCNFDGVPA